MAAIFCFGRKNRGLMGVVAVFPKKKNRFFLRPKVPVFLRFGRIF